MRLSRCLYHMLRVWCLCTAVSSNAHNRRDAPACEVYNKLLTQLCFPVPSASVCGSLPVQRAQQLCHKRTWEGVWYSCLLSCSACRDTSLLFTVPARCVLSRSWGAGSGRAGGSTSACRAAGCMRTQGCLAQRGGRCVHRRAYACGARRPCLAGAAAAGQVTRCEPC